MNILFLTGSYKKNHEILIQSIIRCLQHSGHTIDTEILPSKEYDCILIFNKKKLKFIKQNPIFRKVPVIFSFCISDTPHEYTVDLGLFDHTIIFEDSNSSIPLSSFNNKNFMNMIYYPWDKRNLNPEKDISDKPAIYVNIDNGYFGEMIFLKILPILNQLNHYDFYCQCSKNYRPLLNKNIKILDDKHDPIKYIQKSEMVIGSGYPIIMALLENKKAIVVGEKGFGGIVNHENLDHHFRNFFQGRNGGKYDEYIPLDLLKRSIEEPHIPSLAPNITAYLNANNLNFIHDIENIVDSYRIIHDNLRNIPLTLKKEYLLMHHNNRYWIVNHLLGTFHKRINESECAILSMFNKGCTPQMILEQYPEYESEVMEFINELIAMKILVRYYGNKDMRNKSRHIIE